jgi:hypothetical protein
VLTLDGRLLAGAGAVTERASRPLSGRVGPAERQGLPVGGLSSLHPCLVPQHGQLRDRLTAVGEH